MHLSMELLAATPVPGRACAPSPRQAPPPPMLSRPGGPMKRILACCALLAVLVPACRSAAPTGAVGPVGADPLRAYGGDVRLLRAKADEARINGAAKPALVVSCDMAVRH